MTDAGHRLRDSPMLPPLEGPELMRRHDKKIGGMIGQLAKQRFSRIA
jgi:hypothetical protein